MPKFLAVHPVGKNRKPEEMAPAVKALIPLLTLDAQWIRSWYASEEGKLYCEWNAKDAQSIRAVLAKVPNIPTEGVYQISTLDVGDYW